MREVYVAASIDETSRGDHLVLRDRGGRTIVTFAIQNDQKGVSVDITGSLEDFQRVFRKVCEMLATEPPSDAPDDSNSILTQIFGGLETQKSTERAEGGAK